MSSPNRRQLGVCSWSLHPVSAAELVERVRACGVTGVQLALDPLRERRPGWGVTETRDAVRSAGLVLLSGMMGMKGEDYSTLETIKATGGVRPDATWADNRAAAERNADLATELGIRLVTFHAGFLPHSKGDPERERMLARLTELATIFGRRGVAVAFETGQESADTLAEVMAELQSRAGTTPGVTGPAPGVNFDPANMILYGMGDPVAAVERLAPWVRQVHVKDALPTAVPGTWGQEVPVGHGAVEWARFLSVVGARLPGVDLVIEREAGERRVDEVRETAGLMDRLIGLCS
jgi:sugar phosphate isomerase/epimerase